MAKKKPTCGFIIPITGESLLKLLRTEIDIAEGSYVLKVVPHQNVTYVFDIVIIGNGYEIAEGNMFPVRDIKRTKKFKASAELAGLPVGLLDENL